MEPKAFYSPQEAAEVLSLHEQTVMRLLRSGDIPAGKVGRQWRIAHAALEKMLGTRIEAGKHPLAQPSPAPTPAPAAPAEPPEDGPMKDTGDLTSEEWTDQDLLDLAEEALQAGDDRQAELVVAELRRRDETGDADDLQDILDRRRGQVRLTARCRAFEGEGARENRILVEDDGSVLVWDPVAGAYTRCHALSPRTQRRLAALARDWSPRPEATPGGILDLVQALRRTVDQAPARHRTADDLRHLRTAERILAALQEDLDTDDDGGPNAAVRRLQEVAGALQHADHLLDAATEALPENIREEFAGDLLLVMDRTRQALEDLERLERAVRNRL